MQFFFGNYTGKFFTYETLGFKKTLRIHCGIPGDLIISYKKYKDQLVQVPIEWYYNKDNPMFQKIAKKKT